MYTERQMLVYRVLKKRLVYTASKELWHKGIGGLRVWQCFDTGKGFFSGRYDLQMHLESVDGGTEK